MKSRFLLPIFYILFFVFSIPAYSTPQNIDKSTYDYIQKNGVSLKLDKYRLKGSQNKQTCIIFMFGGSFRGGARDNEYYSKYYNYLANSGYTVIAIDYRLGLKDVHDQNPAKVVPALGNAIVMAVEDLYDATNFVLEKASDWNIDRDKIIISGSSAGAITVLQAEYELSRGTVTPLPSNFKYAGVMAFAGAIFSEGKLDWGGTSAPKLLFHGNMDNIVPFGKLEISGFQFSGSETIAEQLKLSNSPYAFYQMTGCKHEVSGTPMLNNLPEIQRFISVWVEAKQPLMINAEVNTIGKASSNKPVTLDDFIQNNFKEQ